MIEDQCRFTVDNAHRSVASRGPTEQVARARLDAKRNTILATLRAEQKRGEEMFVVPLRGVIKNWNDAASTLKNA